MTQKLYHVGLIRGTGKTICWSNGYSKNTLVVQLRQHIDFLSSDLWRYMGERITTKKHYKENKTELLKLFNKQYNQNFTHIRID